jgi:DNA-binding XRE family transcriptional regulator
VVDGPAAEQAALGFGGLLRRLRDEAGLTQDELAEAAQVSQRAISDLERGVNATARTDTALRPAGALGLDGSARDLFVAAASPWAPPTIRPPGTTPPPGCWTTTCTPRGPPASTSRPGRLPRGRRRRAAHRPVHRWYPALGRRLAGWRPSAPTCTRPLTRRRHRAARYAMSIPAAMAGFL